MNRVFKVVWNDVRGVYMVCDENKMSYGKAKSVKNAVMLAAVAAIFGMAGVGSVAMAAEQPELDPSPKTVTGETFADNTITVPQNAPIAALVSVSTSDTTSLTVTNSDFRNNTLTETDAGGGPTAIGIASMGVDVSVANSHFTNNATTDLGVQNGAYGSAIGVTGSRLTVGGSDFTGNKATSERQTEGSAIYHSHGQISVSNSAFTNNAGENVKVDGNDQSGPGASFGGAVSLRGVGGDIVNSTFAGNKTTVANKDAYSYGGALYVRSGIWGGEENLKVTVSNSVFRNNEATGVSEAATDKTAKALGGAIYVKGDPKTSEKPYMIALDVNKSVFDGNKAGGNGGAIYSLDAPVSVSGSQFTSNEVSGQGGAIMIKNTSSDVDASSIRDSVFSGNRVTGAGGAGAAIAVSAVTLDIDHSSFTANKADIGGAITVLLRNEQQKKDNINRSQLNIANSAFADNEAKAGGAIFNLEGGNVTGSTFTGNKVEGDSDGDGGGAMFLGAESKTVIAKSTFTGNESNTAGGGAIDTRKGDVANNTGATLDISDSVFRANTAAENGGAIRNSFYSSMGTPSAVHIGRAQFDGNIAGQKGGAIYNDGLMDKAGNYAAVAIADTSFTNNSAGENGGAIYNSENATVTLSGVNTFSGNTAGTPEKVAKNDIHNLGTINIAGGVTTLDGGISGDTGTVNINGGALNAANVNKGFGAINVTGGHPEYRYHRSRFYH